jgi:signal transduction histidine kinase
MDSILPGTTGDPPRRETLRELYEAMTLRLHATARMAPFPERTPRLPAPDRQLASAHLSEIEACAEAAGLGHVRDLCRRMRCALMQEPDPIPAEATRGLTLGFGLLEQARSGVWLLLAGHEVPAAINASLEALCEEADRHLPAYDGSCLPVQDESLAEEQQKAATADPLPKADAPMRVLVADDEEVIRIYLAEVVGEDGHHVTCVPDGTAAIEAISNEPFDLVLSDIKMPRAEGIEVLRHAKRVSPHTEVVLITGYTDVSSAIAAVRLGAYEYITKPFQGAETILTVVRGVKQAVALRRENRRLMLELSDRNLTLKGYVKSLEEALRALEEKQEALIHADRMSSLGVLAAGIAHEINNPNTYIRGNLQMLRKILQSLQGALDAAMSATGDERLAEIAADLPGLIGDSLTGTERIERIVSGLRTFARPERDEELAPADPHECIEEALKLVHSQLDSRVEIQRDYGGDEAVPLMKQRMTQVFVNLFINAAQAMRTSPERILRIRTRVEGGSFYAAVEDTGCGISPDARDQIFNPFFTTKDVDEGTGLGLSILYSIVNEHGGEVSVDSTPGAGTTFTVRLPLQTPLAPERPYAVLVVDDDPEMLRVMAECLGVSGDLHVLTANSGFQALCQAREARPEVLVLDVRMPDMDGLEVVSALRNTPATAGIRVILVTGFADRSLWRRVQELSVDSVQTKPLDMDALCTEVTRLAAEARQQAPGPAGGSAG